MPEKRKIAILGGGGGALSAACYLSHTEAQRERFELTVYQQGFRLGGKAASGRNLAQHARIEEHGLHLLMGFYHETFRMMRAVYDEWGGPSRDMPLAWRDVVTPRYRVTVGDPASHTGYSLVLPPRPGLPGSARSDLDLIGYARTLAAFATRLGTGRTPARVLENAIPGPQALRRLRAAAEVLQAVARGLLLDVAPYGMAGFDRIDRFDFFEWIARHGARSKAAREFGPVRLFYDLAFAYPGGATEAPSVAAGTALRSMLNIAFGYRGAPIWHLEGGMGDVIFAPLYEVLRRRGVTFRFFHKVRGLRIGSDARRVSRIDLDRQAELRDDIYDPLVSVGGRPCWPSAPRTEQLSSPPLGSDAYEHDEESPAVERLTLREGADFDAVVLGIALGALPPLTTELARASEPFRAMLTIPTVRTASVQLWTSQSAAALGIGPSGVTSALGGMLSSCADMSHLLQHEQWDEADPPEGLLYLCGVLPDGPLSGDDPTARPEIQAAALEWLAKHGRAAFPGAPGGRPALVRGTAAQVFYASAHASDRYVLSTPESVALRLPPGSSGFDNLVLAGDWTRTRINGGSFEAAVESGRLAAEALAERL